MCFCVSLQVTTIQSLVYARLHYQTLLGKVNFAVCKIFVLLGNNWIKWGNHFELILEVAVNVLSVRLDEVYQHSHLSGVSELVSQASIPDCKLSYYR